MLPFRATLLQKEGPFIGIFVLPSQPILNEIKNAGKVPEGRHIRAIIDTGAESSSISLRTLEELNLIPHNLRPRVSTEGESYHPVFDVTIQIKFENMPKAVDFFLEVAGIDLDGFNTYALIGRDILRYCELSYNGMNGTFSLKFIGEK